MKKILLTTILASSLMSTQVQSEEFPNFTNQEFQNCLVKAENFQDKYDEQVNMYGVLRNKYIEKNLQEKVTNELTQNYENLMISNKALVNEINKKKELKEDSYDLDLQNVSDYVTASKLKRSIQLENSSLENLNTEINTLKLKHTDINTERLRTHREMIFSCRTKQVLESQIINYCETREKKLEICDYFKNELKSN
jgi:hypothetical protein